MDDIREEHFKDVAGEVDDKKKIHFLRWEVYVKDNEDFIQGLFSVSVPHTKGGGIFWTCVKYHIINEKEQYEAIGLRRFD